MLIRVYRCSAISLLNQRVLASTAGRTITQLLTVLMHQVYLFSVLLSLYGSFGQYGNAQDGEAMIQEEFYRL